MIDIRNINRENYYTVSEVAKMLDYKTNQSVYNLINDGKLKANKDGKNLFILGEDLFDYLASERRLNINSITTTDNSISEAMNKLSTHAMEYDRRIEVLEANYKAGIYEKDYYEYAKQQLIENRDNPPRCPYCGDILVKRDSVFNRELNDTYHICKKCESILIKFLNNPRSVHNFDISEERKKIDDKLYFTIKGFANIFRVSMIDLNKQVLPYRLELIDKAIKNNNIKTVEIDKEILIPADEVYKILDIAKERNYTFDDICSYEFKVFVKDNYIQYNLHKMFRDAGYKLKLALHIKEDKIHEIASKMLYIIYIKNIDDFIYEIETLYASIDMSMPDLFYKLKSIDNKKEQQNIIGAFVSGLAHNKEK